MSQDSTATAGASTSATSEASSDSEATSATGSGGRETSVTSATTTSGSDTGSDEELTPDLSRMFVIGIDFQPADLMATWAERGINAAVRRPGSQDPDTWHAALRAAGMVAFTNHDAPLDIGMATLAHDEPEIFYGQQSHDYNIVRDLIAADRDARAGAGVPFFANFAGPWILGDPHSATDWCGIRGYPPDEWCYGELFSVVDWIGFDIYPVNDGFPLTAIASVWDRIAGVYPSGNMPPTFVYVEASNYKCVSPPPSPAQITFQATLAVIKGARGIIYFPHHLADCDPRTPDGTTPAAQLEMARLNFALTSIPGEALQSTVDPAPFVFESGAGTGGAIWSGTRADDDYAYYFTINASNTAYQHVVRFHGPSDCTGREAIALNDVVVDPQTIGPDAYADRTMALDANCQTPVESWQPWSWRIYRIPR